MKPIDRAECVAQCAAPSTKTPKMILIILGLITCLLGGFVIGCGFAMIREGKEAREIETHPAPADGEMNF